MKTTENFKNRSRGQEASPLAGARPLFLSEPPRSGTMLMTRILNAHPRVLLTNETAVFRQIAEENSLRRWEREMGEAEKSMAVELFGPFLQKYGYL